MAEGAAERQSASSYPGLDVVKFLMALLVVEITQTRSLSGVLD